MVQNVMQNSIHWYVPFGRQNYDNNYSPEIKHNYNYDGYYNPYSLYGK